MRVLPWATVFFLLVNFVNAEEDGPRRKKGGFTGATPKPAAKHSADSTPAPKDSGDGESVPRLKKKSSAESTPKPKKVSSEDVSDEKASTPKPRKSTTAESTPKPTKAAVNAEEIVPKKKHQSSSSEALETTKADPTETPAKSAEAEPPAKREHAPAATLDPSDLTEFAAQPPHVQALITAALELTKLNLTYTYGSDDPANGGMDCSGTMSHLLHSQGFKDVPRDSSSQYVWARKAGTFFAVVSKSAESFEFKDLQPGDLLFWTGTYETGREIPISHVMLYLGTEKKRKKRVMFGSSDGRSYDGIQRWGVSVFDFKMPNGTGSNGEASKVDFVGYGRIPRLRASAEMAVGEEWSKPAEVAAPPAVPVTPAPKRKATNTNRTSPAKTRTRE